MISSQPRGGNPLYQLRFPLSIGDNLGMEADMIHDAETVPATTPRLSPATFRKAITSSGN